MKFIKLMFSNQIFICNWFNDTALHIAVKNEDIKAVELLLNHKNININIEDYVFVIF